MTVRSNWRGHEITLINSYWVYSDTQERVANNPNRVCNYCGKHSTEEGHDGCLGTLPGVMNACCGHGVNSEAYIQFSPDDYVRGDDALTEMSRLREP